MLPFRYAADFRSLCRRNPVPCPLIGETPVGDPTRVLSSPGAGLTLPLFHDTVDIRTDFPKYNVYRGGKLIATHDDIVEYWTSESIGFLLGCSYSFETALVKAGLLPRHHVTSTTVPMYRTTLPLNPAGVFTKGTMVVTMRPYSSFDIPKVRAITALYQMTGHGEPIAWGWNAVKKLGIRNIDEPEWGSRVEIKDNEVPVFWGCGVTPQNCLMEIGDQIEGNVMSHYPGGVLACDLRQMDVLPMKGFPSENSSWESAVSNHSFVPITYVYILLCN